MHFNIGDLIYLGEEDHASVFEVLELWETGTIKQIKRIGTLEMGDLIPGGSNATIEADSPDSWDDLGWKFVEKNVSPYYKVIRKIKQMDQRRKVKGYAF